MTYRRAIARALEEHEKKMPRSGRGRRTDLNPDIPENSPESDPAQESREKAAKAAGFGSEWTYRQAKQVVDKGVLVLGSGRT